MGCRAPAGGALRAEEYGCWRSRAPARVCAKRTLFYPSPGAGENPFGRRPPARRWLKQNSTGRRGCQSPFFAAGTFGGCGGRALARADSARGNGRPGWPGWTARFLWEPGRGKGEPLCGRLAWSVRSGRCFSEDFQKISVGFHKCVCGFAHGFAWERAKGILTASVLCYTVPMYLRHRFQCENRA